MTAREMRKRQRDRRNKRRERMLWSLILIICLIVIAGLLLGATPKKYTVTYEYHSCDALWEFVKFCPDRMDRWEYLGEIQELNGMDDMTVHPGEVYMVPIYK